MHLIGHQNYQCMKTNKGKSTNTSKPNVREVDLKTQNKALKKILKALEKKQNK